MIKKVLKSIKINKKRFNIKNLGTQNIPRLSIFKSNKHIYLQLINDFTGNTLCSSSSLKLKKKLNKETAKNVGEDLNKSAQLLNINKAIYPYSKYIYHGKIASLFMGLRKNNFII